MNKTNFVALFSFIFFLISNISLMPADPKAGLSEPESSSSSEQTENRGLSITEKYQHKLAGHTQRIEAARRTLERSEQPELAFNNLCEELSKGLFYIKSTPSRDKWSNDLPCQIGRANLALLVSDIFREYAASFSFKNRNLFTHPMCHGLEYFLSDDKELSAIGKKIIRNLILTRDPLYGQMILKLWNARENDLARQINRANLVLLVSDIFREYATHFDFEEKIFFTDPMNHGLQYFLSDDEELSAIGQSIIRTLFITGAPLYDEIAISFVEEYFEFTQPRILAARLKVLLFLMYQRRPITEHTSDGLKVIRRERDERITALILNILSAPKKFKQGLRPLYNEVAITFVETHYTTTQPEVLRVVLKVLIRIMCQRHLITDDTPEELRTIKRAKDERISSLIDNILKTHRHVKRAIQPLIIKIQEEDARYHAGHASYA